MRNIFSLIIMSIVGTLLFIQCNTAKTKFVKEAPFKITDSFYQEWIGGQPGATGTIVQLSVNAIEQGLTPDSLFFRNRKTKIDIKSDGEKTLWVGNFRNEQKTDINMMENTVDEYGNTVPQKSTSSFELEEGEAVVSYYENESIRYYKLKGIQNKETLFFPSVKPEQ